VDQELVVERRGSVLRVRIDRARKHNALSRTTLARLRAAFEEHRDDTSLACAVVTGSGQRYFAAGGDLRDLSSVRETVDARRMAEEARSALDAVRTFPVPVVALINGDAIGGGAELALACDLRVIRDGARIGYVQGRLGITSGWGGGPDLLAVVGPARALRMMSRAEMVTAEMALAWGLADAVVGPDAVEDGLAQFLAPLLEQTRAALCGFKAQALAARRGESYEARRSAEHDGFVRTWVSPEHWAATERILARSKS